MVSVIHWMLIPTSFKMECANAMFVKLIIKLPIMATGNIFSLWALHSLGCCKLQAEA